MTSINAIVYPHSATCLLHSPLFPRRIVTRTDSVRRDTWQTLSHNLDSRKALFGIGAERSWLGKLFALILLE
ncbi:hypothetical protein VNO78_30743 [Psophocarpus tetragonolobus]|uniref:Uncharacterized protein n=1 Tax=Psophocarpus tetragonolobus TaxID=3891 RepID=A0AAN9X781_PSOTE